MSTAYDAPASTFLRLPSTETVDIPSTRLVGVDWDLLNELLPDATRKATRVAFVDVIDDNYANPCGACPEYQDGGPLDAELVIAHRPDPARPAYRTPVCGGCFGSEVNQLRATYGPGLDITAELPVLQAAR